MNYRADIQILRGLAVLVVIIYHLFPKALPNGYLGVDIFFVISGFLMAALYGSGATKKNAINFLQRRFQRIFPAYIATITATLVATVCVFSPQEYTSLIEQSASALLLVPNMWFWSGEDYFNNVAFTPLIHLWSLGVELQFYLVVPIIAWLAHKNKLLLAALFIVSIVSCFVIVNISTKTAFFWLPFRMWEFLFGYIAALQFTNRGNLQYYKPQIGFICLIALIITTLSWIEFKPHPGVGALLTCTLTSLILIFGLPKTIIKSIFFKIKEKIGTYSYSLYLVHLPIIAIIWYLPFNGSKYQINFDWVLFIAIALMAIFSFACYHLFECGKAFAKGFNKNVQIVTLITIALLVAFVGSNLNKRYWGEAAISISNATNDRTAWRCGKLLKLKSVLDKQIKTCALNQVNNPKEIALLVGDSHADSLKPTFKIAAEENKSQALFMISSCNLGDGECEIEKILTIANKHKVTKLVLHDLHYNTNYDAIEKLLTLKPKALDVVFVKPIPTYKTNIPSYLYKTLVIKKNNTYNPLHNLSYFNKKYIDYDEKTRFLSTKGLITIETLDVFCKPNCSLLSGNKPNYFDNHHLSKTGSLLLKDRLAKVIFQ